MSTLKKWWPSIVIAVGGAFTALVPSIQTFLGNNGKVTAILVTIAGIIAHVMPSPIVSSGPQGSNYVGS